MEVMSERECYRKLYGDLIYTVPHYHPTISLFKFKGRRVIAAFVTNFKTNNPATIKIETE